MKSASFDSAERFATGEWPGTPSVLLDALKSAGWPTRHVPLTRAEVVARGLRATSVWDAVPGAPTPMWVTELSPQSASTAAWQRAALALARDTPGRSALLVGLGLRKVRVAVCATPQRGAFVWEAAPTDSRSLRMFATLLRARSPSVAAMRISHELERRDVDRRFFADVRAWRDAIAEGWQNGPASTERRQALAMTTLARLLFLAFVQRKAWLAGDTRYLARWLLDPDATNVFRSRLLPLFFDALNRAPAERPQRAQFSGVPFLNGGLFERSSVELAYPSLDLPDAALRDGFVRVIEGYRFVEDESSSSSAAVDPRMLGAVFEGLMCGDRRSQTGAFYTPPDLVGRVVDSALYAELAARVPELDALRAAQRIPAERARAASQALASLRVIDPAAGSGAFLLGVLEWLAPLRWWAWACHPSTSDRTLADARRAVITDNLFGIDVSSTAVLLCELRLWLALAAAMPDGITNEVMPLPNLHHRVRVGNALHENTHYVAGSASVCREAVAELADCNAALSNATGLAKRELDKQRVVLEQEIAANRLEHALSQTQEKMARLDRIDASPDLFGGTLGLTREQRAERQRLDVERESLEQALVETTHDHWRPSFEASVHFADIFAAGGFDVVVGNPPWVRAAELPAHERRRLKERYRWMRGGGRAFGSQPDLSVAFVERGVELLKAGGVFGLVLPSKLLSTEYARAMRRGLIAETHVLEIDDLHASSSGLFSADTYPAVVVARRDKSAQLAKVQISKRVRMCVDVATLSATADAGDPWRLMSEPERALLLALQSGAPPLRDRWPAKMGVKTGANAVFLNPPEGVEPTVAALRGRDIEDGEWTHSANLLFAHDAHSGAALASIPEAAYAYIEANRDRLVQRTDGREGTPLWSVFRVHPESLGHRVVWRDIGRTLDAVALPPVSEGGAVVLNSAYFVAVPDAATAQRLRAWMTHPVMRWLAEATAEPALSGYLRFQTTNVGALPVPSDVVAPRGVWAQALSGGGSTPELTVVLCKLLKVDVALVREVLPNVVVGAPDLSGGDSRAYRSGGVRQLPLARQEAASRSERGGQ